MKPNGLVLPPDLSFDEWADLAQTFRQAHTQLQWCVGDWILYGEHRFGEMYAQAIDVTGWDPDYLRQIVSTCKAFPVEARKYSLPFSFYRAVKGHEFTPEQRDSLLALAKAGKMTRRVFMEEVKAIAPAQPSTTEPKKAAGSPELVTPESQVAPVEPTDATEPVQHPVTGQLDLEATVEKLQREVHDRSRTETALRQKIATLEHSIDKGDLVENCHAAFYSALTMSGGADEMADRFYSDLVDLPAGEAWPKVVTRLVSALRGAESKLPECTECYNPGTEPGGLCWSCARDRG